MSPETSPFIPHFSFFLFREFVLIFLFCLVAETFLPHYMGKEAAMCHILLVATNSLSLPSKQLPPIAWKSAVPSFQIHRPQCQVWGLSDKAKAKQGASLPWKSKSHPGVAHLATALKRNIYCMLLVLHDHMLSSCFLASCCCRIHYVLPTRGTYWSLPSQQCYPWLCVLPVNSMYQKWQVFYRKKKNKRISNTRYNL